MRHSHVQFDAARKQNASLYPIDTTDSRFETHPGGIDIRRGPGDRLVGYFRVDPRSYTRATGHRLSIEFLDAGRGNWFVEFIPKRAAAEESYPWKMGPRVGFENSKTWTVVQIELTDVRLTGAVDGADFRIVVVDPEIDEFRIRAISLTSISDEDPWRADFVLPSKYLGLEFPVVSKPDASIVIPVYNRLPYTLDCLRAIREFTPPMYEVIVVDNGSTDETREQLESVPGLTLTPSKTNLGFAKGCNLGAAQASGPWLMFLNNDTIPQPGWLAAMLALTRYLPNVGVVGSKLVYPQTGEVQHAGVSFGKYMLPVESFQYCSPDDPAVLGNREVIAVTGACMLTPKALFDRLNGFDEGFLNGLEDTDYCLRARLADRRVLYCGDSTVLHYKSVTECRLDPRSHKNNVRLFHERWHEYIKKTCRDPQRTIVLKDALPLEWRMDHKELASQTGSLLAGSIECRAGRHTSGHCVYGPYVEIGERIPLRVKFWVQHQNHASKRALVASFDVYDSVGDRVLADRQVRRGAAHDHGPALDFIAESGQILEFRVYWHGQCDLTVSRIRLEAN